MKLEKLQRKGRMVEGYQPCSQNRQLVMVGVGLELRRIWSQCVRQFFSLFFFSNRFQPTPQIVSLVSPHATHPPNPLEKIINWSWCLNLGKACLSLNNFSWVHCLRDESLWKWLWIKRWQFYTDLCKVFTQFCLGIGPLVYPIVAIVFLAYS